MKILSRNIVFVCPIFKVEERKVQVNNGIIEKHWVVVRQPNVTAVALTNDKKIVLIKEIRGKDGNETLELPGGKMEKYDPKITETQTQALCELETETGFKAKNIQLLHIYEPVSNWRERKYFHFAAWNLVKKKQNLENGEMIKLYPVSIHKAEQIARYGRMSFGAEALAIQKALDFLGKRD